VNVTSAFLATLGFEATTVRAAKMYHAEEFPAICRAIIEHIESVCELQAA
jgi:lysyl-tRNA synthetase class I